MLMAEAKKHLESMIIPSAPSRDTSSETTSTDGAGPSQQSAGTQPEATTPPSVPSSSGDEASPSEDSATSSSSEAPDWSSFTPQTAIAAAHKATKQPGSSTACVLQLRPDSSILTAANLVSEEVCSMASQIFLHCSVQKAGQNLVVIASWPY